MPASRRNWRAREQPVRTESTAGRSRPRPVSAPNYRRNGCRPATQLPTFARPRPRPHPRESREPPACGSIPAGNARAEPGARARVARVSLRIDGLSVPPSRPGPARRPGPDLSFAALSWNASRRQHHSSTSSAGAGATSLGTNFSRSAVSSRVATAGFSLRYWRAFSLP